MYNIKAERIRRGIKQEEFANKVGITPQHLCRIEKGKSFPRKKLMLRIAEALDSDVQTLFFSEEE
ncbi:helix-turn-helix transcriptional regulator [Clostridium paraputrificum]|uniref:helix-turn-helix transcriptional regulator n=1 Tax=Clostridium paraputrificum TaxID=29363 RepID=UPI000C07841C|nr:helix-turn-helix transcriptional regulator [Clostridium paraputrificum]